MNQDDFKCLKELANKKPRRKARLIQMLWPEIKQALNAGHTIREIALALKNDGMEINYSNLRYCVACLKKKDTAEPHHTDSRSTGLQADAEPANYDPRSVIKAQRAKKIKFDHDPFATRFNDLR